MVYTVHNVRVHTPLLDIPLYIRWFTPKLINERQANELDIPLYIRWFTPEALLPLDAKVLDIPLYIRWFTPYKL